jgi:hypothetical protein
MLKIIKTRKDQNDQIAETREGLMETYEATDLNTSDIADLRTALEEVYELLEGGEE